MITVWGGDSYVFQKLIGGVFQPADKQVSGSGWQSISCMIVGGSLLTRKQAFIYYKDYDWGK